VTANTDVDVAEYEQVGATVLRAVVETLHSAPGNELATRRRAVSLRWLGDDATFASRPSTASPPDEPNGLTPGDTLGDDPRFPLVVG